MTTPQRVTVITPGERYSPSCNVCGWTGAAQRNLQDARLACRQHASDTGHTAVPS